MRNAVAVSIAALIVLQCGGLARALPRSNGDIDILSYDIQAIIEDQQIVATVTIRVAFAKPARKLTLELASSVGIDSCRLGDQDVPFTRDGWTLDLDLKKAGAPKGEFTVTFETTGRPHNNQRGKFIRTTVSPEHTYIRRQYAWYPRLQGDLAIYTIALAVRDDWQVRTAGDLVEKVEGEGRTWWHFALEEPCRTVGLAAGEYVTVEQQEKGGIALDALVFEGHEEGAGALLGFAARAIEFYTDLFGPMSAERFSLVEMPAAFGTGSGYGMTGYVLIGTGAFEAAGRATWAESLVAHEVAHTWWGREVGFSNFANEMLATYSANRYLGEFGDEGAAREQRLSWRRRVTGTVANQGGVSLDEIEGWGGIDPAIYAAHAYDKAAMLLHMLEREMGRKPFDRALGKFFAEHRGQVIDYRTVAKELGGSRHKWLFSQWGAAEIPSLWTEHEVKKSGSSHSVKGTLFQKGTAKPFRMTITLRAVSADATHEHEIEVKKSKTSFKFSCPFPPERIVLDPGAHLIFAAGGVKVDVGPLVKKAFGVVNSPKMSDRRTLERTLQDLDRLIELGGGKKSECIAGKGRCLFRLGRLDEAQEQLQKAIDMHDSGTFWRAWIHLRLGNIADLRKERSDAKAHYIEVTELPDASILNHQKSQAEKFLEKPYRGYDQDG